MTTRRTILQSMATAGLLPGLQAGRAQGATNKVFVGFPAAGLPDLVARGIAPGVTQAMDGATVVENRPGANGLLACRAVKAAVPDGRVLLVLQGSSPHFMGNQIGRALGVPMRHVPYRDNSFALADVTGGHVSGMCPPPACWHRSTWPAMSASWPSPRRHACRNCPMDPPSPNGSFPN